MDPGCTDRKLWMSVANKQKCREYGTVSGFNTTRGKKLYTSRNSINRL